MGGLGLGAVRMVAELGRRWAGPAQGGPFVSLSEPPFTLGIEEEYLLVDRATGALISTAPESMLAECETHLEGQVTPEFLQSQIEVGTRVCSTLGQARGELAHLRRTVAEVAERHGLAIVAASTHPFAHWGSQRPTTKARYETLARDLQGVGRRLIICGMHVHVGISDDDLRIDLMSQVSYVLPHLLALSTSSPFWRGTNTGLMSYRIAVFDELPRTGLPEQFDSWGEYQRHVRVLVDAGLIEDAQQAVVGRAAVSALSDARNAHHGRLHATRGRHRDRRPLPLLAAHALASAAEQPALAALRRDAHQREPLARPALRHAPRGSSISARATSCLTPSSSRRCSRSSLPTPRTSPARPRSKHARTILARGTSAHWQIATFEEARRAGASEAEALKAVVDMLIRESLSGLAGARSGATV